MPDVLVLQEIESEEVLKDLSKKLKVAEAYKEFVFVPPENGGNFSTAILSKHKVLNAKIHKVYSSDIPLRPIIEAKLSFNLNGKEHTLAIFAVHWKSRRDDNQEIRKMQEEVLYNRMKEAEGKFDFVLSCGDFNQTENDFYKMNEFQNAWKLYATNNSRMRDEIEDEEDILKNQGSYCYKGKWEKLDHFFYIEKSKAKDTLQVCKFVLSNSAPLVKNGRINRYIPSTKNGYSDHLPIGLLLEVCKE